MSRRNGDKARFGRERQRKALQRKKSREVRKALQAKSLSLVSAGPAGERPAGL